MIPNLNEGATKAGRSAEDLEIIVPAFIVPIDDDEERWRNFARMQVAFYGSTPNYAFIFEQLGFEGTTDRIRERQRARDLAGMAAEVSDELLDHFVVTGPRSELADKILERYQGLATRVVSYFGGIDIGCKKDRTVLTILNEKGECVFWKRFSIEEQSDGVILAEHLSTILNQFPNLICMWETNVDPTIFKIAQKLCKGQLVAHDTSNKSKNDYISRLNASISI